MSLLLLFRPRKVQVTAGRSPAPLAHRTRAAQLTRLRRHDPVIARAARVVATPATRVTVHAVDRSTSARIRRHDSQILKPTTVLTVGNPTQQVVTSATKRTRLLSRLGHQTAVILRPPWTGVPRAKTIKGILVHRASSLEARTKLKRHHAQILRAPLFSRAPAAVARSVAKRAVFKTKRKRHEPLILRSPLFARARIATLTRSIVKRSTPRAKQRHKAIIFKAPFVAVVVSGQTTIKYVFTHSIAKASRQRARIARNPTIILRPPWTGVRREKTIKGIYLHGVGRAEQVARRRRHKASIVRTAQRISTPLGRIVLHSVGHQEQVAKRRRHRALVTKSALRVSTPLGRVVLHQVDRTRSALQRRHKLTIILRSKGGTPAIVAATTIKAIYVRAISRQADAKKRRHKPVVLRSLVVVRPGGGKVILRTASKRRTLNKLRKHRLFLFRSRETGLNRKTLKPVLTKGARKRQVARFRQHDARILRSFGGQAASFSLGHFDEPTPAGSFFDEPTPGAAGFDRATPTAAVMDRPTPGAATFDEPTPTAGHFDEPTPT